MGKTGDKYRPSNGTEGEGFIDRFCFRCANEESLHRKDGSGVMCPIIAGTMGLDVTDPEYPKEWTYDAAGNPTCTRHVPHDWSEGAPTRVKARHNPYFLHTDMKPNKYMQDGEWLGGLYTDPGPNGICAWHVFRHKDGILVCWESSDRYNALPDGWSPRRIVTPTKDLEKVWMYLPH